MEFKSSNIHLRLVCPGFSSAFDPGSGESTYHARHEVCMPDSGRVAGQDATLDSASKIENRLRHRVHKLRQRSRRRRGPRRRSISKSDLPPSLLLVRRVAHPNSACGYHGSKLWY